MAQTLSQEEIDEVCRFQGSLNREDEWLFFNMAAVRAIREGDTQVTFVDKYKVMKKWEALKGTPNGNINL